MGGGREAAERRRWRRRRNCARLFASWQLYLPVVLMTLGLEWSADGAALFGRHQDPPSPSPWGKGLDRNADDRRLFTDVVLLAAADSSIDGDGDGASRSNNYYDPQSDPLYRIAFGSCSHQSKPTTVWHHVLNFAPQMFIWLGDNIYGDYKQPARVAGPKRNVGPWKVHPRFLPAPMQLMQEMYDLQKSHPMYSRVREQAKVIGTWDDHDYGLNDAGKEFEWKQESQKLMLDFLDEPINSPRRNQEGVYAAYDYGPPGKRVKVILTDTRYHRESPSSDSDLLGEEQWQWLERELNHSTANVHIIGSSVQVIPNLTAVLQPFGQVEGWARFPASRSRLFRILKDSNLPGIFFISGDVHFADMNRYDCALQYPLYEFTASGLTQSVEEMVPPLLQPVLRLLGLLVPGPLRIRRPYGKQNFGTIEINWDDDPISIHFKVHRDTGETVLSHQILLTELQSPPGTAEDSAKGARRGSDQGRGSKSSEAGKFCVTETDLSWFARHRFFFAVVVVLTALAALAIGACYAVFAGVWMLLHTTCPCERMKVD
ncbi:hypothetical protein CBR_g4433 [Chara braunii]|uniref:PhoD-like phosphatase metallophosphatase domain-containing protein n=1 Tax=Chara braunii TaxID=69332 RepID=A0A388KI05_CHABU|nr:hypothetical protein CBR_g4433 [Chara braunii]|eukprot:GBG69603.1 hypothetical protein CBR_g4433 [Chara braunii]